jgi:hypothetical protein
MALTWKKLAYEDDCILKTYFGAKGQLISASADDTPALINIGSTGDVLTVAAGYPTWTALGAPVAHNIFSTSHGDTTGAESVVDGDVIIGNVTPKWSRLAISIPAATYINVLGIANAELRPSWKGLFSSANAANIAANATAGPGTAVTCARIDHVHGSPATWPATQHGFTNATYHSAATANMDMAGYQLQNNVIHTVANATVRDALTGAVGKFVFQTDTLALYVCTVAA